MTDSKIDLAVNIALRFGMIDGAHHKQWVIDQMLRSLLDSHYDETMRNYNSAQDYEKWDMGIAP